MMRFTVIVVLLLLHFRVSGSDKPKVEAYYKRVDRIGPFFLRWYWQLRGIPTAGFIETLKLTDDNRFDHFTSTGCLNGSEYGTWTRKDNILILKVDSSVVEYRYRIKANRLYYLSGDEWVMKRRK